MISDVELSGGSSVNVTKRQMQTITLHLRSSLKQRNSYELGESLETESHHKEGMAEWLCDGLQIHLPWFESEYPLQQHRHTGDVNV